MNLYNHNANINYPFVDDIELPFSNAVILDLRIQIEARPGLAGIPVVLVKGMVRTGNSFAFAVSVSGEPHTYTTAELPLGAGGYTHFTLADLTTRFMVVVGADAYEGTGTLIDDEAGFQIRPDCVLDVSSFELTQLSVGANAYIGNVLLKPGRNTRITTSGAAATITFALNAGQYECDGSGESDCAKFLHFLNGAGPDASGSVSIAGGSGIKVTNVPAAHAIDITAIPEDECSV